MRQRQYRPRVGARLSASAACRKLSMWRTPRATPRLIALALALPSARSAPSAYLLSRTVLSRRDRPRSVHRAPPPVAALAHESPPHSSPGSSSSSEGSGPRFSFSLSLSLFLFIIHARLSSLSLSLLRFPSFSHRFPSLFPTHFGRFFPHSPSLHWFPQASRFFLFFFLRFLAIPHALTHCGPVTVPRDRKSFPALESGDAARTRGSFPLIRAGTWDFPIWIISFRGSSPRSFGCLHELSN